MRRLWRLNAVPVDAVARPEADARNRDTGGKREDVGSGSDGRPDRVREEGVR